MILGAQLYTVTKACQTLDGLAETLTRVADMGYTSVQLSGVCAYDPEWMKEQLDKNGLKCAITHNGLDKLQYCKRLVDQNKVFGCKYIGLGKYNMTFEPIEKAYERFRDIYRPVAKGIKECGGYFMYHNHDGEFAKIGDKTVIEKMAEDFSADEMGFTVDVFWCQAGGADPAEVIERYAGRVPCIHLKDFKYGKLYAPVGEGNLNFDRIIAAAESAGVEYALVEQDNCYNDDPFDCLKRSLAYLNAMGLK